MTNRGWDTRKRGWLAGIAAACALWAGVACAAPEKQELKLGFIKLTDCAPLVVAYEKGFFEDEGLYVTLEAQANWKLVLDRVTDGSLDGAHMLPGQVLSGAAGIGQPTELVAVAGMGLNTLAITLGNEPWKAIKPQLAMDGERPRHPIAASALKPLIDGHAGKPLTMGMVFPTSTHNYLLRYWLAAGGIHPGFYTAGDAGGTSDAQVLLSVTPPPQMPATLAAGTLSGYSVGEPWNQQAVLKGIGVPVVTAAEIWSRTPEKVFGLRRDFVERNPQTVKALVKAIIRAEQWLDTDRGAHRAELVDMLARSEYVGADAAVLRGPLTGTFQYERGDVRPSPEANVYFVNHAGYPFYADAVWYLTQMRRWGQVAEAKPDAWYDSIARKVYRADLYRAAASELIAAGTLTADALPPADSYAEGHARFIDGIEFDPHKPNDYLARFAIGAQGVSK